MRIATAGTEAFLGNGRMLVALSHRGEIQQWFWPLAEESQMVMRLLGGLSLNGGAVLWQDGAEWVCSQTYEEDRNVLVTAAALRNGIEVRYTDAVASDNDLLVRQITVTNGSPAIAVLSYALYQWLRIDEAAHSNSGRYDEASESLVHQRKGRCVAMGADRPMTGFAVGGADEVLGEAGALRLRGRMLEHGDVASGCCWHLGELAPGGSVTISLYWALGAGLEEARALLAGARDAGGEVVLEQVRAFWRDWLMAAQPLGAGPAVERVYRRALLLLALFSDCFGAGSLEMVRALAQAGYPDLAAAWYHRALGVEGDAAQVGALLHGIGQHIRLTGRHGFAAEVWPAVNRAAEGLLACLDSETGLPRPAPDLWGERALSSAYAAAAVSAGLLEAAHLAHLLGHGVELVRYHAAALETRRALLKECVRDGLLLRGRHLRLNEAEYQAALAAGARVRSRKGVKGYPIYERDADATPDASLVGVSSPFGALPADHPVMGATAEWLESHLWRGPTGGMARYAGDRTRAGQPWLSCTLWLGLFRGDRGEQEAARGLLEWALSRRTRTGLLAEQLDTRTGAPFWGDSVVRSHALFVLLALREF